MKFFKRIFLVVVACMLTFGLFLQFNFEATSGKLRTASICTAKNGVKYGKHGDGHWHRAKKYKSGWYPQGASLGKKNPCKK